MKRLDELRALHVRITEEISAEEKALLRRGRLADQIEVPADEEPDVITDREIRRGWPRDRSRQPLQGKEKVAPVWDNGVTNKDGPAGVCAPVVRASQPLPTKDK